MNEALHWIANAIGLMSANFRSIISQTTDNNPTKPSKIRHNIQQEQQYQQQQQQQPLRQPRHRSNLDTNLQTTISLNRVTSSSSTVAVKRKKSPRIGSTGDNLADNEQLAVTVADIDTTKQTKTKGKIEKYRQKLGDSSSTGDHIQKVNDNNTGNSNQREETGKRNGGQGENNDEEEEEEEINENEEQSENNQITRYFNKNMIIYYGRECLCILILIFSTYATYQKIPPEFSNVLTPKPFFPKGSLVHDWPAGQLAASQVRVARSELAMVMFYAPWCAESQYARYSYEFVARLYYREVHFAAINCWQPGGECRHQYAKVMSWPVLMAYMQNGLAVPYNGRITQDRLARFVRSLLEPVKRVTSLEHLLKLTITQDAVVTAFLNMKLHSAQYRSFYRGAVEWLERDPFQEVKFSVFTGESAEDFGVDQMPTIRMYLWNKTLEFKNSTFTPKQLVNWVANNVKQISVWLSPSGSKSTILAQFLRKGPAIVMFTPRNLNDEFVDAYSMFRQIGLEYFNCDHYSSTDLIREIARNQITKERHTKLLEHQNLLAECEMLQTTPRKLKSYDTITDPDICDIEKMRSVSITFANIVNSSNLSDRKTCFIGPRNADNMYLEDEESCLNEAYFQPKADGGSESDRDKGHCMARRVREIVKTSMLNSEFDNRSSKNLQRIALKRRCEWAVMNKDKKFVFLETETEKPNFDLIAGMSCKWNKSLSLLAMDSELYHMFAERLGVDVLQKPNKSMVFILDQENESTFKLDAPITTNTLIDFLSNFFKRKLTRNLKSYLPDSSPRRFHRNLSNTTIRITEISSKNFAEKVLLSGKTVIVFFYSTQCALCGLMAQRLLHVSYILSTLPNFEIVRIDGDQNDLPWPYTMEKYPSLVAFPIDRQAESRIFPPTLEVNVQNVIGFILANLNRPLRLYGLMLVCKSIQKPEPFSDCIQTLQSEIIECISYNLRQWRSQSHTRGTILRRLQLLQRFYLHLYRIDKHSNDFVQQIALVDSFVRNITNIWTVTTKKSTQTTTATMKLFM